MTQATSAAGTPEQPVTAHVKPHSQFALVIGSIGVVYGDIGTSPLYAFRASMAAAVGPGGQPAVEVVLGVLSLMFWSLIIAVTIKYVVVLLRADNNGEGGTLSLTALASRAVGRRTAVIFMLGTVGAAMFYADTVITPAISVLSAMEGLQVVTPAFDPFIVPLTVVIIVALFIVQSRGTASIATFFGPIMVAWFVVLAVSGFTHLFDDPRVFWAVNPVYAVSFMLDHGIIGLVTLGFVFLTVTGGEALYADLGHFGRKPIQIAWFSIVLPSLVINYFSQGALVLANPAALENPFFMLFPPSLLPAVIVLATIATCIASQATITGAYSITRQAIQLGLLPRLAIRHTSATYLGQIYIPRVNWMLLAGVLLLVAMFRTSNALATTYGVAVTTTMVVDGLLGFIVIWKLWRWRPWAAAALMVPLVLVDLTFLGANLLKLVQGAWVPLAFGVCLVTIIITWRRGTHLLAGKTRRTEVPLESLVKSLEKKPPHIVAGTAIFLTSDPESAPTALLHNLKHNKILHENNIILTIRTVDTPRVTDEERVRLIPVSPRFSRMEMVFGFMETPNIPNGLALVRKQGGWPYDIMSTSFFLSRRTLKPAVHSGMPRWQDRLFIMLARSASDATDFFHIPTGRVVEVGTQVTI